jgi:hypothetical protein
MDNQHSTEGDKLFSALVEIIYGGDYSGSEEENEKVGAAIQRIGNVRKAIDLVINGDFPLFGLADMGHPILISSRGFDSTAKEFEELWKEGISAGEMVTTGLRPPNPKILLGYNPFGSTSPFGRFDTDYPKRTFRMHNLPEFENYKDDSNKKSKPNKHGHVDKTDMADKKRQEQLRRNHRR